jgi:hypothetical protein
MNTMFDAELHEGGSTSFTLIFLLVKREPPAARARASVRGGLDVRAKLADQGRVNLAANIVPAGYECEAGRAAIS